MSLVRTTLLGNAREAARRIKRDAIVVWFGARDARTPTAVKLLAFALAAYAFSSGPTSDEDGPSPARSGNNALPAFDMW